MLDGDGIVKLNPNTRTLEASGLESGGDITAKQGVQLKRCEHCVCQKRSAPEACGLGTAKLARAQRLHAFKSKKRTRGASNEMLVVRASHNAVQAGSAAQAHWPAAG